jgi:hypothetical protein
MNRRMTKRDIRFLLFLLVAHAFFFAMAAVYKRIYMGDSFEYVYMGLNIKNHFWFYCGNPAMPVVPEYLTLRPPGYPLFLALVYLFTVNNWVVIVLQNLLSVFNIYYMRDTMRKLGYTRLYDYLLVALVILYPAQFIHTNTIAPDLLLQTCVLVYFRHFILLYQLKRWRNAYWMSLALVAGFMIKPILYPFALVHCILLLAVAGYFKGGHMRAAAAGMFPLVVIMAYMSWNHERTGKVHFSSTQSFNAIYYYYFYFSDKKGADVGQAFLQSEHEKIASLPTFKERYDYANRRGLQLLKENFFPYMVYHLKHSARLLIDPGKGEWDMFTGKLTLGTLYQRQSTGFYATLKDKGVSGLIPYIERNPSFPLMMVVFLFNFIRTIGLFLFLYNKQTPFYIRMFVLALVVYFAITTGPIANTRYFIPVSLVTIGCAALGYQRVLQRMNNKTAVTLQST